MAVIDPAQVAPPVPVGDPCIGPDSGLVERLTAPAALRAAWEHVRAAGGVAGVDRESISRFSADLDARFKSLATAVRLGHYAPLPALSVRIPRDGGRQRELAIPAVEDRVLQRAFLDAVAESIEARFLPCSHGYRRGGSVTKAVKAVRRSVSARPWVADCDIKDFFGSVPHDALVDELAASWLADHESLRLVRLWLETPILRGERIDRAERGLLLGSPLSPLLANIFLHRLDVGLWRPDQTYIRFADDFVVCCTSEGAAAAALRAADEILRSLGLELAREKSSAVDSRSSSFVFLGHLIRHERRREREERETPAKRTLYLTEPGSRLMKRQGRLIVQKESRTLLEAPVTKVREVHVASCCQVTTGAMLECLERGIDVVFVSTRGRYLGRLQSRDSKNPLLRQAQLDAAREPETALRLAHAFIGGKIANQRRLFQRNAARKRGPELAAIAARLKPLPAAAARATTLDTLRSIEGQASRCLFDALPAFLNEDYGFARRARRPPTDPVNSLLSFAYTLLTQEMVSAAATAGLDPHVGFLHQPRYARPSLALDLVEEFRPLVADTLVIGLLNRHVLGRGDFHRDAGTNAVLLRDEARKVFLREYEHRMLTLFTYQPTGDRISYRRALLEQARQLVRAIQEPGYEYVPVLMT